MANCSLSLLQSLVSHGPSEINLICCLKIFLIIINVELSTVVQLHIFVETTMLYFRIFDE